MWHRLYTRFFPKAISADARPRGLLDSAPDSTMGTTSPSKIKPAWDPSALLTAVDALITAWKDIDPKAHEMEIQLEVYASERSVLCIMFRLDAPDTCTMINTQTLTASHPHLTPLFEAIKTLGADHSMPPQKLLLSVGDGTTSLINTDTGDVLALQPGALTSRYRFFSSIPTTLEKFAPLMEAVLDQSAGPAPTSGRWLVLSDALSAHTALDLIERWRSKSPGLPGQPTDFLKVSQEALQSLDAGSDVADPPYCPLVFHLNGAQGAVILDKRYVGVAPKKLLVGRTTDGPI